MSQMRWFKLSHDMPNSPNWRAVCALFDGDGPSIPEVISVALLLLSHASKSRQRGSIDDFSTLVAASNLGIEKSVIDKVLQGLAHEEIGFLKGGRIAKWDEYQEAIKRDDAAERKRKSRDMSQKVTPECDMSQKVTTDCDGHNREEKRREEKKREEKKGGSRSRKRDAPRERVAAPSPGFMIGKTVPKDQASFDGKVVRLDEDGVDCVKAFCLQEGVKVSASALKAAMKKADEYYSGVTKRPANPWFAFRQFVAKELDKGPRRDLDDAIPSEIYDTLT